MFGTRFWPSAQSLLAASSLPIAGLAVETRVSSRFLQVSCLLKSPGLDSDRIAVSRLQSIS